MGRPIVDMTGQKHGMLKVINYVGRDELNRAVWQCECACGGQIAAPGIFIRYGRIKSCGCQNNSMQRRKRPTPCDVGVIIRLNKEWRTMLDTGITVCPAWHRFSTFRNWALGLGYTAGMRLERIYENRNYEPYNCYFAT